MNRKKKGIRWICALLLLLIAVSGVVMIQAGAENVTFRDSKLESALKSILKVSTVTVAKMETLTDLDLSGKGITDLTGLEKAKNLKTLSLRNNQVADLSAVASMTLLETLDVCGNQVVSLTPLSGLSNLRVLQLTDNKVADLTPVAQLKMLQFLFCERNALNVAADSGDMQTVAAMRARGTFVELGNLSEQVPGEEENDPSSNTSSTTPKLTVQSGSELVLNNESKYMTGVQPGKTASALYSELNANGGTLKILKGDGTAAVETDKLGTGMKIQLLNGSGQVLEEFTVVLYGDTNGDGKINVTDLIIVRRDIVTNGQVLSDAAFEAANLKAQLQSDSEDVIINVTDLIILRKCILGALVMPQQ